MKKIINILNLAAILLILAGVLVSCGKGEENSENPYRDNIIGKWKLMYFLSREEADWIFDTVDYSNENIIYEFRSNNKLIITGYVENDFSQGEHYYSYQQLIECPTCDPGENMTIDDNNSLYCFAKKASNEMSIGGYEVTIDGKIKVINRKLKQIK